MTGTPIPKPATLVDAGTGVSISTTDSAFVSRGGLKLAGALDRFSFDVTDMRAIDVGASTGGFTDCLLQRGAATVVALDVGYGQLDWRLRTDERVTVVERTNIRHANAGALGAPFNLVVADLSFISLRTVAGSLVALGNDTTDYILLVKPQFEAGRDGVGKGGIVRDDDVRVDAVQGTLDALADFGLGVIDIAPSPIRGAKGNREVIGRFRHGPATVERARVREAAT